MAPFQGLGSKKLTDPNKISWEWESTPIESIPRNNLIVTPKIDPDFLFLHSYVKKKYFPRRNSFFNYLK